MSDTITFAVEEIEGRQVVTGRNEQNAISLFQDVDNNNNCEPFADQAAAQAWLDNSGLLPPVEPVE